jgi:UDP-2,3-diacylglucosamine pyrophosphatase LpxH
MYDALIISDIHLGSKVCNSKRLYDFLQLVYTNTGLLVINGDFFDNLDFRRLKKSHWKILSLLRKLSKYVNIVWIRGNHDDHPEVISSLVGLDFQDEYIFSSGNKNILCLHGDRFDDFIYRYPTTSKLADYVYRSIQVVDKRFIPSLLKNTSKTYLGCTEAIMKGSTEYALSKGADCVCVGHTHLPLENKEGSVHYFNSGCWTDSRCTYLSVNSGEIKLEVF